MYWLWNRHPRAAIMAPPGPAQHPPLRAYCAVGVFVAGARCPGVAGGAYQWRDRWRRGAGGGAGGTYFAWGTAHLFLWSTLHGQPGSVPGSALRGYWRAVRVDIARRASTTLAGCRLADLEAGRGPGRRGAVAFLRQAGLYDCGDIDCGHSPTLRRHPRTAHLWRLYRDVHTNATPATLGAAVDAALARGRVETGDHTALGWHWLHHRAGLLDLSLDYLGCARSGRLDCRRSPPGGSQAEARDCRGSRKLRSISPEGQRSGTGGYSRGPGWVCSSALLGSHSPVAEH